MTLLVKCASLVCVLSVLIMILCSSLHFGGMDALSRQAGSGIRGSQTGGRVTRLPNLRFSFRKKDKSQEMSIASKKLGHAY